MFLQPDLNCFRVKTTPRILWKKAMMASTSSVEPGLGCSSYPVSLFWHLRNSILSTLVVTATTVSREKPHISFTGLKRQKPNKQKCTINKITEIVHALWLLRGVFASEYVDMVVASRCFAFRALITQARLNLKTFSSSKLDSYANPRLRLRFSWLSWIFPTPLVFIYIRLCKHGKCFLLLKCKGFQGRNTCTLKI